MNRFNKEGTLLAKHEVVTIDSLIGITIPTSVFIINRIPEPFKDKWGTKGGKKLPERMIITGVGKNETKTGTYYNIIYYTKDNNYKYYQTTAVLPGYKLAKLTGSTNNYLTKKLDESMLDNLDIALTRGCSTLGCDPEVFVVNGKNELMPAFTFLKAKGDKDVAKTLVAPNYGKAVYWDGFQAEFETQQNGCLAIHTDSIWHGLDTVLKEARKVDPKARLSSQTVFDIPPELLQTAAKEHVALGCMPSFNAYNMSGEKVPDGRKMDTRSAGGHIHFDLNYTQIKKDQASIIPIVKALDAVIGMPCVSLFASYDNPERRRYYGLAGEYRMPPHGLEYRVLSNAWLLHPFIMNVIFDLSRIALSMPQFMKHWKGTEQEIIEIINTCDVNKSKTMMRKNKRILYKIYKAAYPTITEPEQDKLFQIFMEGMESVIEYPDDIEKNWCLGKEWISKYYPPPDKAVHQTVQWAGHGEAGDKNFTKGIAKIVEGKKIA